MKTKKIKADKIQPYWRNPRKNEDSVEKIKSSIEKYGYNNPIIVDKENVIIAGHTRFKALRLLNYTEIDCIVLDISKKKAKEYRVIDNKTAEYSDWDYTKLIPEIREMDFGNVSDFFDDIDQLLETKVGKFEKDISQEKVDKKAEDLSNKFSVENYNQDYLVPIICTECGADIHINPQDIQSKVEKQKVEEQVNG